MKQAVVFIKAENLEALTWALRDLANRAKALDKRGVVELPPIEFEGHNGGRYMVAAKPAPKSLEPLSEVG